MNSHVLQGKWKQVRGQFKVWYGKLTNDELERTKGRIDQLVGLLEQKYGYTRQRAEKEIDHRLTQLKIPH